MSGPRRACWCEQREGGGSAALCAPPTAGAKHERFTTGAERSRWRMINHEELPKPSEAGTGGRGGEPAAECGKVRGRQPRS